MQQPPPQQPLPPQQQQQPVVMMAPAQQYPAPPVQYVSATPGVQYVPHPQAAIPVQAQTVMASAAEHSTPSHNLVLTVVITAICALINLSSLMIGGPALICSLLAYNALKEQRYSVTKNLGYAAAALSVVNIAYTGVVTTIIVGVSIGCSPVHRRYYYYYNYRNEYYYDRDRC